MFLFSAKKKKTCSYPKICLLLIHTTQINLYDHVIGETYLYRIKDVPDQEINNLVVAFAFSNITLFSLQP